MSSKIEVFYSASFFVTRYALMAGIIICTVALDLPTTHLAFLKSWPGILIIYILCIFTLAVMIWRLPELIMSLFGIPGISIEDGIVLVRGWSKEAYNIRENNSDHIFFDDEKDVIVFLNGNKRREVYVPHLVGYKPMMDFLYNFGD